MSREKDLDRFYLTLDDLANATGGPRKLTDCIAKTGWPKRGVYFFMEDGEIRHDSGTGPRIVRVGTHALKAGSRTTLWNRLSQHRGVAHTSGGNQRGSIFRRIVGAALSGRDNEDYPTWNQGSSAPRETRQAEHPLEIKVSLCIGNMPFLWLAIEDEAGPDSERGFIERNSIALLSNFGKPVLDAPSANWLGHHSDRERVRASGLWNSNHVDEPYDSAFLDRLEQLVSLMRPAT